MKRKKNLVPNVEQILTENEESRSNDKVLLVEYWERFDGVKVNGNWLNIDDFTKLATPPSSIIRARRMVTVEKPELNGNEHSQNYRENKRKRMVEAVGFGEVV
jgi:hypothetical protein